MKKALDSNTVISSCTLPFIKTLPQLSYILAKICGLNAQIGEHGLYTQLILAPTPDDLQLVYSVHKVGISCAEHT